MKRLLRTVCIIAIGFTYIFFVGCSGTPINNPTLTPTTHRRDLIRSNFDFLKAGISYEEIVSKVGEPDANVGSGLYIYVYILKDGTIVSLTFRHLDYLDYAFIKYPDGSVEVLVKKDKN